MIDILNYSNLSFLETSVISLFFLFFLIIFVLIIIAIIIFLYKAYAWYTIAKKLKYNYAWIAWIPFAQFFLLPILAKKHWVWGFILLIPFFMQPTSIFPSFFIIFVFLLIFLSFLFILFMKIYWGWIIFERRKYPGWYNLFQIVPIIGDLVFLIFLGIVAWKDKK